MTIYFLDPLFLTFKFFKTKNILRKEYLRRVNLNQELIIVDWKRNLNFILHCSMAGSEINE